MTPAQRTERLIMELERGLQDPNLTASQRDEYKMKLVAARQDMEKINAERENQVKRVYVTLEDGGREKIQTSGGPLRLVAFKTERVSADAAGEVLKRSGLKIGDTMTEDAMKNLRAAATAVDEHFRLNMHDDGRGGVTVVLVSD